MRLREHCHLRVLQTRRAESSCPSGKSWSYVGAAPYGAPCTRFSIPHVHLRGNIRCVILRHLNGLSSRSDDVVLNADAVGQGVLAYKPAHATALHKGRDIEIHSCIHAEPPPPVAFDQANMPAGKAGDIDLGQH